MSSLICSSSLDVPILIPDWYYNLIVVPFNKNHHRRFASAACEKSYARGLKQMHLAIEYSLPGFF